MSQPERTPAGRSRREPPRFRPMVVRRIEPLSPWMVRVTFAGPALEGLTVPEPAASVRLLLPSPGTDEVVVPAWNGNEFLLPDGRRPTLRTFTPWRVDTEAFALEVEIVTHGGGAASRWVSEAEVGAPAAVSGPGRGYSVDNGAPAFLLGGDETAIPAIDQLLAVLPAEAAVRVLIEVAHPDGRVALAEHPRATVEWCDLTPGAPPGESLVTAVKTVDLAAGTQVWVAGEAAGVQRIRRHLFQDLGLPRSQASVRGYWKHGRSGDTDTAQEGDA
jgi:NADPH-dependent ferric siderophore reductase